MTTHITHHTHGIVLGGFSVGESDRYLSLFTRDLGFVSTLARGVREERSKLRYALQDLCVSMFSLVRGRDIWRITGAIGEENIYQVLRGKREQLDVAIRLSHLLRRLLHGEERNESLYNIFSETLRALQIVPSSGVSALEILSALRILHALGYVSPRGDIEQYLLGSGYPPESLVGVDRHRKTLLATINRGIHASQL